MAELEIAIVCGPEGEASRPNHARSDPRMIRQFGGDHSGARR
jgi:hypothetical protein